MKKTLVVSYTPRHDSNTRKLLETFFQSSASAADIEHLDLVAHPPPLLLEDSLNALLKRNFMGIDLTEEENKSVSGSDMLMNQILQADRIVMAFPMYNFSLPATVKAWVDSVVQKDRTFKINDKGNYEGLCHGKRALILMAAGADYREEPYKSINYASPLIESCLGFMGIETQTISAFGLNQYTDRVDDIVAQARQEIVSFLKTDEKW